MGNPGICWSIDCWTGETSPSDPIRRRPRGTSMPGESPQVECRSHCADRRGDPAPDGSPTITQRAGVVRRRRNLAGGGPGRDRRHRHLSGRQRFRVAAPDRDGRDVSVRADRHPGLSLRIAVGPRSGARAGGASGPARPGRAGRSPQWSSRAILPATVARPAGSSRLSTTLRVGRGRTPDGRCPFVLRTPGWRTGRYRRQRVGRVPGRRWCCRASTPAVGREDRRGRAAKPPGGVDQELGETAS